MSQDQFKINTNLVYSEGLRSRAFRSSMKLLGVRNRKVNKLYVSGNVQLLSRMT